MGLFKKPKLGFPFTALDVKGLNDFMQTIMYKVFGNINFGDLGKDVQSELTYHDTSIRLMEDEIISKVKDENGKMQMSLRSTAVEFAFNDITGETNKVTINKDGITIKNGSLVSPKIEAAEIIAGTITGTIITGGTITGTLIKGEEFQVASNIALHPPTFIYGTGSGEIRFYKNATEYATMKYGSLAYSTYVSLDTNFRTPNISTTWITTSGITCEFPPWALSGHTHSEFTTINNEFTSVGNQFNGVYGMISDLQGRVSALESA